MLRAMKQSWQSKGRGSGLGSFHSSLVMLLPKRSVTLGKDRAKGQVQKAEGGGIFCLESKWIY